MSVTYSFKKTIKGKEFVSNTALLELILLNDITNKSLIVSDKLLKRCDEIKNNLKELPKVLDEISSFKFIIGYPWRYHKLSKVKSKYYGSYGINLTYKDRLIFDGLIIDWVLEGDFIVIGELFHYLKDLTDEEINAFTDDDEELYKHLSDYAKHNNIADRIQKAYNRSKDNPNKIWFFKDKTTIEENTNLK
jgi:hypothetical protein